MICCEHGNDMDECVKCDELAYEQERLRSAAKHGELEEPQNSQLNELISNILKTQAVTVQMVADIIDKVNKLEFAIKELREKQ